MIFKVFSNLDNFVIQFRKEIRSNWKPTNKEERTDQYSKLGLEVTKSNNVRVAINPAEEALEREVKSKLVFNHVNRRV